MREVDLGEGVSTGAQAGKTAAPGILGSATGAGDHGGGQEQSEPSAGEGLGDTELRVWARCRWGVWTLAAARGRGQGHWRQTHLFARVASVSLSCPICGGGTACLAEGCRGAGGLGTRAALPTVGASTLLVQCLRCCC